MSVLVAATDSATRQWCEVLQKKSRYNNNKRVFSKDLTELALRPDATSFVPLFVRMGLEHLFKRSLGNPTLCTASVNTQAIDRIRGFVNRGSMPPLNDNSDDAALAQSILSFYAEMPQSLIPGSMFNDLWSYYLDSLKTGTRVIDKLKQILLSLPIPNQVNLKFVLTFFATWAEYSGTQVRLPELLSSYLICLRKADVPDSFKGNPSDVTLKIFDDLLSSLDELPFPDDSGFADFVRQSAAKNAGSAPDLRIPVTIFDKDDFSQLIYSVENPNIVLDLNEIAPSASTTSSHRHTISFSTNNPDSEGEFNSGSSQRQECFEEESEINDGSVDSPRKDSKHSSTRVRASHFFKKFRQSFSTKKKSHASTPNNTVSFAAPNDEDSNSSEGCGTPTGSGTGAPSSLSISDQNTTTRTNTEEKPEARGN